MKIIVALILFLFLSMSAFPQVKKQNVPLSSKQLADNFIKLYPDSVVYPDEEKSKKWNYEQGLIWRSFYEMWTHSGNNEYLNYIQKNLDYYVESSGKIKTYKLDDFNIDNISPGRVLLDFYSNTKEEKYKKAADTLREQLRRHPRTTVGGFWHKKIYPNQMWLDGLFMAEPFYAKYALMYNEKDSFDDIANQFLLIEKYLKDKNTGLYFHGWDESKLQKWSNPETGVSPCFWGRAMGWYLMALVDVLDYFPQDHTQRKELIRILNELSLTLLNYRDPKLNLWYQIVDKEEEKGNFIETSASLMFIYAYAKASNLGYLSKDYYKFAEESFISLQENLIEKRNGQLYLQNICAGAGLGGNPYRDGSYSYYVNERIRTNDFKGYGPLLLAAIELEKGKPQYIKRVGLDYFFNNENKKGSRYHYVWEDPENSGFSELAKIINKSGAEVDSVVTAPTWDNLKDLDIYIIVDPDTPLETSAPNYINSESVESISRWVKEGGVLVLLANDSANCEFTNLNKLAEEFGIHFNGDSKNRVTGKNFDLGKFDKLPEHPVFKNVKQIYLKEVSTIALTGNAIPVLEQTGKVFMAGSQYGKGYIFAVGDPWFYNEYIDNRKLPGEFDNYHAAENLFEWLLHKTNKQVMN